MIDKKTNFTLVLVSLAFLAAACSSTQGEGVLLAGQDRSVAADELASGAELLQEKPSHLPDLGEAPELTTEVWLNTAVPLRLADLRGKVVLLDMWTFG